MERVATMKIREILRLRFAEDRSVRETARSVGKSLGVVSKLEKRARAIGLDWAAAKELDDETLEIRLYGPKKRQGDKRDKPDPLWMDQELRKPGVTLELLHLEYLAKNPDGYRYTVFCDEYRKWRKRTRIWMRQDHKGGERMFVDYSGKKPRIYPVGEDPKEVELFVAVLGASSMTYAEVTETQRIPDFLGSQMRALEFFGGVPAALVPDQLKSAVTVSDRYEPLISRGYSEFGEHFGTAIVPARPMKPRDKAKVEVGVQVCQRWILARMRNERHSSPESMNKRIQELVDDLNDRRRKYFGNKSRRELFEVIEKPFLKPLPTERFTIGSWKKAKVAVDYHVEHENHYYSVPYTYRGEEVHLRISATTIEVFKGLDRIASHLLSRLEFKHTTNPEHMPEAHRAYFDGRTDMENWAGTIGPSTFQVIVAIFDSRVVPEQGWRSARGLRRLGDEYGAQRLEEACEIAVSFSIKTYKQVERLLKFGTKKPTDSTPTTAPIAHENVRGADYYETEAARLITILKARKQGDLPC